MMKYSLIALLAILLSTACTNNEAARQTLIGKWKYDTQTILQDIKKRDDLTTQQIMMVEGSMALYATATFEFHEDGDVDLETNGAKQLGTWKLNNNGDVLFMNFSGQDQPNNIKELSEERFILAADQDQGILYNRVFIPAE